MDSSMVTDVSIEADFTYTHDYSSGLDTEFNFTGELTSNVDEIEWFIENGSEWLIDPEMSLPYNYIFSTNGESASYDVTLYAYDYDHGCLDTATRTIVVPNLFVFYAPNSFTPNGDADNNTFFGYANDISYAKLEIYNRWGQQIFFDEGVDLSKMVWDGTFNGRIVQDGAYSYKFTIWPVNYNNGELSAFEYPGHVIVLR
jgi:gliding motility-associated-like protein